MLEEEFLGTYEFIQGRLIGYPAYAYGKKQTALKKIKEFLSENPEIGQNIFDFITFISVLRTSKHNRYAVIPFNQYTSKNAIKLYKERTQQHNHFIRKFQKDNNLRDPYSKVVGLSDQYLESQRRKYLNTPKGFLHCQSYGGYLYDVEKCENCRYKYICKQ